MSRRALTLAVVWMIAAGVASAATPPPTVPLPAIPAGHDRYIVVLKSGAAEPSIGELDGTIEGREGSTLYVSLPPGAAENLRNHASVKYVQRAIIGPSEGFVDQIGAGSLRVRAEALRPTPLVGPPTWTSGDYVYDGAGNIAQIGTAGMPGNDGKQSTFLYDGASRLKTATIGRLGGDRRESYEYDPYGNMTSKTINDSPVGFGATSAATNRMALEIYDEVGNVTGVVGDASTAYTYDPLNMLIEKDYNFSGQEMYVYTPSDERIGAYTPANGQWLWTVRDFDGKPLRQYSSSAFYFLWTWVEDYAWQDGRLLGAERQPEEGGRRHFHLDHLGSPRLITGYLGQRIALHDYAPFGEEIGSIQQERTQDGHDREEPLNFTGHERDFLPVAGENTRYLDYMHARYYSPVQARFLGVDPIIPTAAVHEPQRWNRYSYVSNNPIKNADPTGKLLEVRAGTCDDKTPCYSKVDTFQAVKNWVGADAAKHLVLGKNGQVTLAKGMSFAQFAKFGAAAGIVANLMRSTDRTAAFALSSNVKDDRGNPTSAFTRPEANGTFTEINPGMFPRMEGGATQTLDTAMAHDLGGHGLLDMWGISPFNKSFGSMDQRFTLGVNWGEAFAVTFENQYRASQGMDIRGYYINKYDYDAPAGAPKP